ncbi:MAG: hypothetical protein J5793_00925 [Clostridia bacterium]|nr:hypothetical protein [Clostridia bacterium]
MKNRIKAFALAVLLLVITAALAGCGDPDNPLPESTEEPESNEISVPEESAEESQAGEDDSADVSDPSPAGDDDTGFVTVYSPDTKKVSFLEDEISVVIITDTPLGDYCLNFLFTEDLSMMTYSNGYLFSSKLPEWVEIAVEYDGNGNATSFSQIIGGEKQPAFAEYGYDEKGRIVSIKHSDDKLGSAEFRVSYPGDGSMAVSPEILTDGNKEMTLYGLEAYDTFVMADHPFTAETFENVIDGETVKGFSVDTSVYTYVKMTEKESRLYRIALLVDYAFKVHAHFWRGFFWDGQV